MQRIPKIYNCKNCDWYGKHKEMEKDKCPECNKPHFFVLPIDQAKAYLRMEKAIKAVKGENKEVFTFDEMIEICIIASGFNKPVR